MNPRRWFQQHSLKLLAIRDTPQAIALGVAIGIFFGFTPLFGLKTLLSIVFAWLTGCNVLAAVLAVSLHDVIIWLMPLIYWWEYALGYWLLSRPHQIPHSLPENWHSWKTFLIVGKPMLLGSMIVSSPFAVLTYALTHRIFSRHQAKKLAKAEPTAPYDAPLG